MSYEVGDYVIVSHPEETTDYEPGRDTFVVTGFASNGFKAPVVRVRNVAYPNSAGTVFYPRELSWEDGSRP